ncbi:hypothetical protein [Acinetobacter bouvetii]|jgi:hypothetical protein|uniref:hypothetical protein n=1 Tax=Acinetobacter bouvetii TaxID=202951 RepID=UPI0013EEDFED|nr:hypothetical protein [Acinetobacter bouvetii]
MLPILFYVKSGAEKSTCPLPPCFRHDDQEQFINLDLVSAPFKLLFQRGILLTPESG